MKCLSPFWKMQALEAIEATDAARIQARRAEDAVLSVQWHAKILKDKFLRLEQRSNYCLQKMGMIAKKPAKGEK